MKNVFELERRDLVRRLEEQELAHKLKEQNFVRQLGQQDQDVRMMDDPITRQQVQRRVIQLKDAALFRQIQDQEQAYKSKERDLARHLGKQSYRARLGGGSFPRQQSPKRRSPMKDAELACQLKEQEKAMDSITEDLVRQIAHQKRAVRLADEALALQGQHQRLRTQYENRFTDNHTEAATSFPTPFMNSKYPTALLMPFDFYLPQLIYSSSVVSVAQLCSPTEPEESTGETTAGSPSNHGQRSL